MTRERGPRSRLISRQRNRSSYAGKVGIELIRHLEADRMDDDHRPLDVADRAQRDARPERAQLLLESIELELLVHRAEA